MLTRENTGLVVVDVQGKLATLVEDSDAVVANITTLVKGAKTLKLPIVWLEQNPEKLGATVKPIGDELGGLKPVSKFTFDGCGEQRFLKQVKKSGIRYWLVCGIETHICVYQTAKSLRTLGFGVELISDCVSSRTAANKQVGVNKMMSLGIGISSLEMCLYELVGDCRDPEFKTILKLIK
ncbi:MULTISPECIES: isochorismatase family protein [unclassified Vibrio]|uniref:isochorismatase family protein n=2 Tax=Vibrio TaxID=662 RepID=UPI001360CD48|nr:MULTISPECIES: isochorismatase family protein [unclassified Vibrio]NAW57122.1 isochorismatase family protein [Vibrio sp. V36_P2S2PM302]NAX24583.1 isochorismatase family protein [Vibrio sp. V38_P2S17PM301]